MVKCSVLSSRGQEPNKFYSLALPPHCINAPPLQWWTLLNPGSQKLHVQRRRRVVLCALRSRQTVGPGVASIKPINFKVWVMLETV